MSPRHALARDVGLWSLCAVAVVSGVVFAIEVVEGAVAGWALTIAPLALGGAAAHRIAAARAAGIVTAWEALGHPRWGLVRPLVAVATAAGLLSLLLPWPGALELPPPVAADAPAWWDGVWRSPPPARWTVPPAELTLWELLVRVGEGAPAGARGSVDGADLIRRLGLGAAWPLAVVAGAVVALARRPREPTVAAAWALVGLGAYLLAVALAVGAYSSIT